MEMLTLSNVSKRFGSHQILNDLSFQVSENTIYGFIGENGAGKTTTMKMILGLYSVDSGVIQVNGERVTYGQTNTNRYIGYLPDVPEFYGYMTPTEYLRLCGEITGVAESQIKNRIPELLELVGLEKANKRIQGFSRGMKQRLGIAQALLNKPKILICDEPTSALDPIGRKEIIDILQSIKKQTTVIFSTHILSDVERICDEIGLLHNGTLALNGTLEEIRNMRKSDGFMIEFDKVDDAKNFANIYMGCEFLSGTELSFNGKTKEDMMAAMRLLYENQIYPVKIEMREPTLESLFLEVVSK
ncbi:ABC transporter ATP-binding protein [Anaeromicropila herbilytica]|uniref:ABC transporter ATP-binding protein n=1 Tax=Anaeromicropila herbilytica TaxID=2785025 RepID=A0A7R7ELM7_9FIRM|nr:ABC transporter ATP-binding protein [Anaeromicropila herbilytica]BCN30782.1 ABC transporter ATP-binding protein [Anaeromicropila herbilytica]